MSDAQLKQRLNTLAPLYQKLSNDRIRIDSEIERHKEDVDASEKKVKDIFQTTDRNKVAKQLEEAHAGAEKAVNEFGETLNDIQRRLQGVQ